MILAERAYRAGWKCWTLGSWYHNFWIYVHKLRLHVELLGMPPNDHQNKSTIIRSSWL